MCANSISRILLPASLNVACHELLGVLLQDLVDILEQGIQRLLQRLALLRQRRGLALLLFLLNRCLARARFLFLLGHVGSHLLTAEAYNRSTRSPFADGAVSSSCSRSPGIM